MIENANLPIFSNEKIGILGKRFKYDLLHFAKYNSVYY